MLDASAPDEMLVDAAAANQTAWMGRIAEAAGGVVRRERGVTWMSSRAGAVLAFPRISRLRLDSLVPRFLAAAGAAPEASCWSLLPTRPPDLDAVLRDAGFREGWQVHWMAVSAADVDRQRSPEDVHVGSSRTSGARPTCRGTEPASRSYENAWRENDHGASGIWPHGETTSPSGTQSSTSRPGSSASPGSTTWASPRTSGAAVSGERSRSPLSGSVAPLNATAEGEPLYRQLAFRSVGVALTWWR